MMLMCLHSLVGLLLMKGVVCQHWSVTYTTSSVCALEGSVMNLFCSYTYPRGLKVQEAFWINKNSATPADLAKTPNYSHRVQVDSRIDNNTCHLHLRNLTKADAHHWYYCRITTNETEQKWIGKPGVKLSVTGLEVTGPKYLRDEDNVTLTCKTTCSLSGNPGFIWKKNGRPVERNHVGGSELHLRPFSYGDEGSYSCSVKGHEDLPSPELSVTITYPPKNTSASVTPPGAVVKGSLVNLTCSSDANPPVENYTWFKVNESTPVGSGQQYSITNISSEDEGQYYCEARNSLGIGTSAPITIIFEEDKSFIIYAVIGVTTVCGIAGFFCVCFWIRTQCAASDQKNTKAGQLNQQVDAVYSTDAPDHSMASVYQNFDCNRNDDDDVYQNI